jgi:hypothetical protein
MFLGDDWLEGQSFLASNGRIHDQVHRHLDRPVADGWVRVPG